MDNKINIDNKINHRIDEKVIEQVKTDLFYRFNNNSYFSHHEGLANNIEKDIELWAKESDMKLLSENPFEEEEIFIKKLEKCSADNVNKIEQDFPKIRKEYCNIAKDSHINFDFLERQFALSNNLKTDKAINDKKKTICRSLISHMKKNLIQRKDIWTLRLIDKFRKEFVKKILEKIKQFMKLEKLLAPFSGKTGFLWDMSSGIFQASGFEILQDYADLLEQDKGLQELAELLGRQNKARIEYEKEIRASVVIKTEYHPKPAFKGQIAGIRTSDDISSVLPCELALLKNPITRKLFEYKFVQKQLLSFRYENMIPEQLEETKTEEVIKTKEIKDKKGPIIICVDTSGSMNGTPERVAKTITFALCRIAMEEKRKCYLISFSTGIETLDLSDFNKKNKNALNLLVDFLRMSFNGGTDAEPALEEALRMLKTDNYKQADVLTISDFVMGSLNNNLINRIEEEKKNKTNFYSLVIGNSSNNSVIKCFNYNWSYDLYDSNADRKLIRQLQELKKDKNKEQNLNK